MSETANLKIIAPDANSVLVPLHSHFAALADSTDQAITNRFQVKHLLYGTIELRNEEYHKDASGGATPGTPVDPSSGKPDLVDGDMCTILQNKRQFIWNVNPSSKGWMAMSKRFVFDTIAERDAMLSSDIFEGDTCYVSDNTVDQSYLWDGSAWLLAFGKAATFIGKQTGTISASSTLAKITITYSEKTSQPTTGFTEASGIITVPYTGWYNIVAQVNWASQPAATKDIIIAAGPSASPVELFMNRISHAGAVAMYTNVGGMVKLNAGEVVRVQAATSVSTSGLNITGAVIPCSTVITYMGA
jgi:hypothetical protein